MKKIIVTTTINSPTKALKLFNNMPGWELIVIGDMKTPHEEYKDYNYFSPDKQKERYPELSKALGWNCIQRRNIGFVEAYRLGADIIASVDDDNIPLAGWGKNLLIGKEITIDSYDNGLVFNPLSVTPYPELWHRGYPLQALKTSNLKKTKVTLTPDIQADLWNGEPDIDAVCRFMHNCDCEFDKNMKPFTSSSFSPFNSQNTFLTRNAIEDYFMFPFIGRMDDIWASYFMEALGFKVVYNKATVYQDRNPHDITSDFVKEFKGYVNTMHLLKDMKKDGSSIMNYLSVEALRAYTIYITTIGKYE